LPKVKHMYIQISLLKSKQELCSELLHSPVTKRQVKQSNSASPPDRWLWLPLSFPPLFHLLALFPTLFPCCSSQMFHFTSRLCNGETLVLMRLGRRPEDFLAWGRPCGDTSPWSATRARVPGESDSGNGRLRPRVSLALTVATCSDMLAKAHTPHSGKKTHQIISTVLGTYDVPSLQALI